MNQAQRVAAILTADPARRRALGLVRSLGLPDCWIAAGFVRNAVWDVLHGRPLSPLTADVDVIWFSAQSGDPAQDRRMEATLRAMEPLIDWSVKNQARMHHRNNDAPYGSAVGAMQSWPETATAVAVRETDAGSYEIAAPFGLDDLFALTLRPTPRFSGERHGLYLARIRAKRWLETWPHLCMQHASEQPRP